MKKMKVVAEWQTLKIGDRMLCKVSVFEPNLIPGQNPGSFYYLRITAINKNETHFIFDVQYEDKNFVEVDGLTNKFIEPIDDDRRFVVLRECDETEETEETEAEEI